MSNTSPTVLCGSLSLHPVSLGAAMHRAGYAALGLDYAYVPFRCTDLAGALAGMRALGIRGFGVSMPFKRAILPWLDRMDPLSARIDAVNTVVNEDGVLTGHNTDAVGAVRALQEAMEVAGRRICVIGAGGAARAAAFGLADAGARLHLVNRTPQKAAELASTLGRASATSAGLDDLSLADFDALVNASSAGMAEYGAPSPVDPAELRPDLVVMDIVYKPMQTELLQAAASAGASTIHGGRMLLHQACRQFELYTGRAAPLAAMDAALQAAIQSG
jgi:shikimate dehydrogenase